MKKLSFVLLIILFCPLFLSGCTHEMVSLYIYKMPNKLVYEIGEELEISGLELKNIKTDSALIKIHNNNASFTGFDSSTSGIKEITVSYGNFTSSFNVFVANKVVNNNNELISALNNLEDGDILLIKEGDYVLENPIEINNSNVIIGGEGKGKTIIDSFVIIGGYLENNNINFINNSENVSFIGLTFNINKDIEDQVIIYENEKYNKTFGAINIDKLKTFKVISCSFNGFVYAILANELINATITANNFENLIISGITVNNSILNSTISKNVIRNIGNSVVSVNEDNSQMFISGINLAFNKEDNCGVTIYKNSISKIAIKDVNTVFLNEKKEGTFANINFMFNSSALIIRSSGKNNLQTNGISIFFNSIGSSLNNILYNTSETDKINSSSVMYMSY